MNSLKERPTNLHENHSDSSNFSDNTYWRLMYEELEEQMQQMMKMSLELVEQETSAHQKQIKLLRDQVKTKDKQLKYYKNFEHRIKVTWIGKFTLFYIKVKRFLKKIFK